LLIVDSIQTMQDPGLDSPAGSISQVRNCTYRFQEYAKSSGTAVFIVGHVTKEGSIAGPKVMEHIVDTVLSLEGDGYHTYRLLRSMKNRFGATTEVGVFEMASNGMQEVTNPSETFLAERMLNAPGSAIAVTLEGTRPLLVEVQGLTTRSAFGHPRRTANGVDPNRLLLTVAVLARRAGVNLIDQDVFVNVVGGLRISEPAADLAMATALASSLRDRPIPAEMALIGEVGLSGELRTVPQIPARLKEVEKLGFRSVVIPASGSQPTEDSGRVKVLAARSLREAFDLIFA
jgi:DNA repair protein RadA/Sms